MPSPTSDQAGSAPAQPPRVAYTAREVAAALNVPVKQVYELCRDGDLPSFRVGKHLRIPTTALDDYVTGAA